MGSDRVLFPGPGCVVEFMHGNRPVQAWVLEEQSGGLRLFTVGQREVKMPASRLLPWSGPAYASGASRQVMQERLEFHKVTREALAAEIDVLELWELAQGEVASASLQWFAELLWPEPGIDRVAALGQAMLACKTHFKFNPPEFELFDAQQVESRETGQKEQARREELAAAGVRFFRALWEIHCRRRPGLTAQDMPSEESAAFLRELLLAHLADPERHEAGNTWKLLTKALPEDPHLPLHLAVAWGLVPEHHNYWLDRAGYEAGPDWDAPFAADVETLRRRVEDLAAQAEPVMPGPDFVSLDPSSTEDFDDAFSLTRQADGSYDLRVALAAPGLAWPFESDLDKAVLRRGNSLYLPEGDLHMLPHGAGKDLFGLKAGILRPALLVSARLDSEARLLEFRPGLAWVKVAANLKQEDCEAALGAPPGASPAALAPAAGAGACALRAPMLSMALGLARLLQKKRIEAGAVITERPDSLIVLRHLEKGLQVSLEDAPACPKTQLLVGEIMILANSGLAAWAVEQGVPLIFRTQDVGLPKEFAGVWVQPHDIARVIKALPPAILDVEARPHAGLGKEVYAPCTAPMRRYSDLLNEAQILHHLAHGVPRFSREELKQLLPVISSRMESSGQVQRFRPRYWKLLYFLQQNQQGRGHDRKLHPAVVTEENDHFVTIMISPGQLAVRGRRSIFGEKTHPGQRVQVRLGKINPLYNEIQVQEVLED